MSLVTGTRATSSPSRPVTQCTGASKWVPECSPVLMSFQYQAGPRSSYLLISCRANGEVFPNGSGSLISGVLGSSRAVRSTTSTVAARSAAISVSSTGMVCLQGQVELGNGTPTDCRSRARL